MSKLDLVVFGATGFTGKRAVEDLARGGKTFAGISWAVAGRSQKKLEDLLTETSKKTGADVSSTEVLIADVGDEESLKRMCARARVVVNACGPYRHYGEPVVKAAIESKTHYVDVSGEPQFIETMQLKYDNEAREAGVYVISACGFDSIPNDMGVVFLEQNFPGTLNSVESYLSSSINPDYAWEALRSGSINYGTWESLVYSLAHYDELGPIRKKLYPERLPTFKPKLENRWVVHKRLGGWCVPFLGADNSIVYRSQRRLLEAAGKRPVQFRAYLKFSNILYVFLLAFFGGFILLFSKFETTRQWLLDHPRLFSCGAIARGPKQSVNQNTKFQVQLLGRGWTRARDTDAPPTDTIAAKVSAMDPGYGFTTLALLLSAVTIIREQDKMPEQGGVITTAVAFRDTSLIKYLQENDVKFEIIDAK